MIQRRLSLHCSPAASLPTRDLQCPWLLCSSTTLDYCFPFQLFFGYALENLVLLVMITVKTNILIICCSSCNLSIKKSPKCGSKGLYSSFLVIFSYALLVSILWKFCRLSVLPSPLTTKTQDLESTKGTKSCILHGDWKDDTKVCFGGLAWL